jgi:serine/threonine protein kinase
MSENRSQLVPGAKLGQYTLGALLGRGRDTEVFRVFSHELKRDAALKVYHPALEQLSSAQFKSEIGTIAALKHPNIMRLYDFGVEGEWYYIVMELIEGTGLRDVLSAHPTGLGRDKTLLIFSQIASAVACAHDQHVVHGNIKPDNVLMDHSQRPVLTDFNIPCLRERGDAFRFSTPAYLAPEQAAEGTALPQSDIYALGILLYEMVTGDVPFKGSAYSEIASQHLSAAPKPPGQIVIGLDPRIESAILKALSKNPPERYESARDMLGAMESQESAEQFQTVSLTRDQVQKRRSEIKRFEQSRLDEPVEQRSALAGAFNRRRFLMIGGAILLAIVVILIILIVLFAL